MACLREPCPSAWMLNQSAFAQNLGFQGGLVVKNLPACQPVRDMGLIPRSEGWPFQEVFVRLMAFLTLIPHLHPSLFF